MKKYWVVVYAICKNEKHFVDRFMASALEADEVIIADTGSTDGAREEFEKFERTKVYDITVNPWRFDVARNISLSFVPEKGPNGEEVICVCFDIDEVFDPGWRAEIEKKWTNETTRMKYLYIWDFGEKGESGTKFWYEKIHARKGFRWVKPVHEILKYYDETKPDNYAESDVIKLKHLPDPEKSRSSYLPLLEVAVKEEPECDRNAFYLGREYMFYGHWDKSIATLSDYLDRFKSSWTPERSTAMRFISRCYIQKMDYKSAEQWLLRATAENIVVREPWFELSKLYNTTGNFVGAYYAANRALQIKDRDLTYITENQCWSYEMYDVASLAAWYAGFKDEAVKLCQDAIQLNPKEKRLRDNLSLMINLGSNKSSK